MKIRPLANQGKTLNHEEYTPLTEDEALYQIAKRLFVDDDLYYNNGRQLHRNAPSYDEAITDYYTYKDIHQ